MVRKISFNLISSLFKDAANNQDTKSQGRDRARSSFISRASNRLSVRNRNTIYKQVNFADEEKESVGNTNEAKGTSSNASSIP